MGVFQTVDAAITDLAGQWNMYSTALVGLLVAVVAYRVTTMRDPDTHPMLLARQGVPSSVRHEGQSAIYRSQLSPHSFPLQEGLNVKDPGTSKWAMGRTGDLRDVWRKAVTGGDAGTGKLLTVHGSQNVVEHKLEDITRQINLIGQHIAEQGGIRVAIYLPNSVELLATLFACSFYPNLTTVLLPFDVSPDELISMLRRSAADTVVTATGAFPFDAVVQAYPSLRQLIWVVDEGNKHMDWNEVPEGMGGSVNVATWQDILQDAPAEAGTELPAVSAEQVPKDVVTFWQTKPGQMEEMVRFTQANLVSGIAGQMSAIPLKDRLCQSDLFLPADSLANIHTLIVTLTALYQNTSVALNSVAGQTDDLVLATQGVAPTVIVAKPSLLLRVHEESSGKLRSYLAKASHGLSTQALTRDGVHAATNLLSSFASVAQPAIGTTPGKLRILFVADRAGTDGPRLSARALSDLRIFTGARIVQALVAAKVAGAVSQTGLYDYRVDSEAHFGPPVTCAEVFLKDKGQYKTTDDRVEGEIYVRGPCVAGGEANLGVIGKIQDDTTIAYV